MKTQSTFRLTMLAADFILHRCRLFGKVVVSVGQNFRGIIVKNVAVNTTTDYHISGSNANGPLVIVSSVGDISGTVGASHPFANCRY